MFCFGCGKIRHKVKDCEDTTMERKELLEELFPYFVVLNVESKVQGKEYWNTVKQVTFRQKTYVGKTIEEPKFSLSVMVHEKEVLDTRKEFRKKEILQLEGVSPSLVQNFRDKDSSLDWPKSPLGKKCCRNQIIDLTSIGSKDVFLNTEAQELFSKCGEDVTIQNLNKSDSMDHDGPCIG